MLQLAYHKLGIQRGAKRLWLQGMKLAQAGYAIGARYRLSINRAAGCITLTLEDNGDRIVSRKQSGEREYPVIDLSNQELAALFGSHDRVRVVIKSGTIEIALHPFEEMKRERTERLNRKLASGEPLDMGVICQGLGIMDNALEQGLADEGVATRLAWAIEMEAKYLQASLDNNPVWREDSVAVHGRAEEVEPERLSKVDILSVSLPCTGASPSGKAKNRIKHAEEHATAGTAFIAFLAIVRAVNPTAIVFENVPNYQSEVSYILIKNMLREWGYDLHETVVDESLGALERRKRMCSIWLSEGTPFNWNLRPVRTKEATLGDIMEDVPLDSDAWKACTYLDEKEKRDIAAGKGFRTQRVTPDSDSVGTIGKGVSKWRSTEPMIQHPNNPALKRLLTPREHARVKTIPESLVEGLSATLAHECLGQSVLHCAFVAVGRLLARTLKGTLNAADNAVENVADNVPAKRSVAIMPTTNRDQYALVF